MSQPATAVRRALIAVAIAVGLAACGGSETPSADGSPTEASAGQGPLSFSGELLGGGRLEGSSLAGKAVMLWFWAPT
jgi:hypothetical protein